MTVQVVQAPAFQPVALAEAREWCRVESDDTDHDAVLTLLVKAMTAYAENLTGRAFVRRQLKLYLPCWPMINTAHYHGNGIEVPYPPLIAVSSLKYRDEDGVLQDLDSELYDVHNWREPGLIVRAYDEIWPSHRAAPDAIQVTYFAGYAPSSSPDDEAALQENVPASVKAWIQARLLTLFDKRDQLVQGGNVAELPRAYVDGLLDDLVLGARLGG